MASTVKDIFDTFERKMESASRFDASADISTAMGGGSVSNAGRARPGHVSEEELEEMEAKGRQSVSGRRADPVLDAAYDAIMAGSDGSPDMGLEL